MHLYVVEMTEKRYNVCTGVLKRWGELKLQCFQYCRPSHAICLKTKKTVSHNKEVGVL